jgi:hypothetical protein
LHCSLVKTTAEPRNIQPFDISISWFCYGTLDVLGRCYWLIMTSTMLARLGFIRPAVNDTRTCTTLDWCTNGEQMPSAALVLLEMSGVPRSDHGTKSWQIQVWVTISRPNDRRRYSPKDAISDVGCHASSTSTRIQVKTGKGVMTKLNRHKGYKMSHN